VGKTLFAILCLAAVGFWYAFVGGKQVDESHVRGLYADYVSAFDNREGKALCELFDAKVGGRFKSTSRTMTVKESFDKASACAAVEDIYEKKRLLEAATGMELHTNFEVTIKSIAISADKKTATAEVLIETRIGTEQKPLLDMRSEQVDTITRSFGKTRITRSDGTVSFFRQ